MGDYFTTTAHHTGPLHAMTTIKQDLLKLVDNLNNERTFPAIERLFIPRMTGSQSSEEKFAKFGVLILDDGSCGFFYALLDNTLRELAKLIDIDNLPGTPVKLVANWYSDESPVRRSVGMAAINAISDHIFRQSQPDIRISQSKQPKRDKPKHMGMVGFFPPLVAKFRESGQKLTVLEQNPDFIEKSGNLEVTLDPQKLKVCDEVLCTASTLLNDSLQDILNCCGENSHISLIGPTAGCLPDALFDRGISSVGASRVVNLDLLLKRMQNGESWGDSVEKYTINRQDYKGYKALLK